MNIQSIYIIDQESLAIILLQLLKIQNLKYNNLSGTV